MKKGIEKAAKPYGFWNWGTGITIAIVIAASLMIFLVYKSMHVSFDMVEKDYYAEELKFDDKMKASRNASELSSPLTVNETADSIIIKFPAECIGQKLEGTLMLYRPSAKDSDISLPLMPDKEGKIVIAKSNLLKGLYQLKANWEMSGKLYNVEKDLFVRFS